MVGTSSDDSQRLASWHAPAEDILITGISGKFPDSDNVMELADNLFNKVDLISDDDRRWKLNHPEIPQRTGKINNIKKFDASFFNIDYKEAHVMEPICRILMEKVYEALIDAGINPEELRNTNTGVFAAVCSAECEKAWYYDKMQVNDLCTISCSRSMLAHRVSSWLGLKGPSHVVDTACSSSLYAFELAYKSVLRGQCDAAIVGCANLCLDPKTSLEFFSDGIVICYDGSPDFAKSLVAGRYKDISDTEIENQIILHFFSMVAPNHNVADLIKDELNNIASFEDRMARAIKSFPVNLKYSIKFQTEMAMAASDRVKAILNYKSMSKKLKSPIVLLRQKELPPYLVCEENYSLDKCTESTVTVHKFDNDHITIVENVECANVINEALATYNESREKSALDRRLGN